RRREHAAAVVMDVYGATRLADQNGVLNRDSTTACNYDELRNCFKDWCLAMVCWSNSKGLPTASAPLAGAGASCGICAVDRADCALKVCATMACQCSGSPEVSRYSAGVLQTMEGSHSWCSLIRIRVGECGNKT